MKILIRLVIVVLALVGVGAAFSNSVSQWWQDRNRVDWRQKTVERGTIVSVVNSTGTVQPVMSVQVGSFVSGPIDEEVPLAEFNQEVKKGDMLAKIDPRIYKAAVLGDKATVKTRKADVTRATALLEQAQNDEARAKALAAENPDFISESEMDQIKFNRMSLAAQLEVARASLEQAEASLQNSQANLDYTDIHAPVDGIIIDRKIEPGQTLAAQFQTPELFVLAPNMRKEMYVFASVDEADIGLIREARLRGNQVEFTVDAYPDDLFHGQIKEVRFSSTTTENVVTYPVIVTTTNPDLKLLPGMTADISFQIEEKAGVLKIPNAALRFYPQEVHVRDEDKKILAGDNAPLEEEDSTEIELSAAEKSDAAQQRRRRHVWIQNGQRLRAVEIAIGISDSKFTELVSGDLQEGIKLITGIKSTP